MKKALFFLFTLFLISTSYATEDQEIQYKISPEFSGIEQYYKKDLSNSEIEDIKKIYGDFRENVINFNITFQKTKNCIKVGGCSYEPIERIKGKVLDEFGNFTKKLNKYIDENKKGIYTNWIIKNLKIEEKEEGLYFTIPPVYTTKKLLTDQLKTSIDSKIEKIPEEKRQATLEKLILLINKQNPSNERKKQLYSELKEYIQSKIDDLESQSILPADFSNL